jgi:hypothetical protein
MKEYKVGDKIIIGGNSGFCGSNDVEEIVAVDYRYNEKTGEKYQIVAVDDSRWFNAKTGRAYTPPTAYYIKGMAPDASDLPDITCVPVEDRHKLVWTFL